MFKQAAQLLADSVMFRHARILWEQNQSNFNLSLSRLAKAYVGTYLILKDFSQGDFPPKYASQQEAYQAEIDYIYSVPGIDSQAVKDSLILKPFWGAYGVLVHIKDFVEIVSFLQKLYIDPPQKILELGCGSGWLSEFLALIGFEVIGTTISPHEIDLANQRKAINFERVKAKRLDYLVSPMEKYSDNLLHRSPFNCILVYEALHHSFDWKKAIESGYAALESGGWFIIAKEPNQFHTFISYRVAKLTNTHEVGMNRHQVICHLKRSGFKKIVILKNFLDFWSLPLWIAAQK